MANCNPYTFPTPSPCGCTPNPCTPECVTLTPDYASLGCINNFTECILYNGLNIPELSITKNENLNVILQHLKDKIIELTSKVPQVGNNFVDDTTAALGGIPIGGVYHTAGAIKIRLA